MEGNKVPNLHHSPRIPWKAQVREPVCGVNVNESKRQSQGEMDAQRREDQLVQRRILDKVKRSLMTEEEKEAVREKRRNAYIRRKVARSGDEKKAVKEAETSAGQPHQGATRKEDNTPSIATGGREVSNLPQSPRISEQAQHPVDEKIGTGMSTDMEPNNMTEIVKVVERASLYLMFFQTAPDEKSRSCKLCNQSYPIKTAYGNLGRHLKYRHPGYDKMGDVVSSPLPQPITAVSERANKMGDVIPSPLPQLITTVMESTEKKDDAVPSPSPQLVTSVAKKANVMSDAVSSPLLPSVTTVSKRDQLKVKHSNITNFELESCNKEHTS
ncbi:uncharacterized protein LOC113294384 [Papaver somniferum]|uniref:uncharacterized protein LOC113294384 n=1 Tax=Papaver somniferum TaxID=3469 RepID=UPI000E7046BC|nr:uncharacterized protein LOC113294384 [Papaver somniferum]XP_026398567.1 uncharacterized protein LOC113294384 [Papaver somniferum]